MAMVDESESEVTQLHQILYPIPWYVTARLQHLWDFPGTYTGVGCHFLGNALGVAWLLFS